MDGYSVTIRMLDPPLHEFLPERDEDIEDLAKRMGISGDDVRRASTRLHESNPMLGHRGCRLAITYPEIIDTQVTALFEATLKLHEEGLDPKPEIMIPLVSIAKELEILRARVVKIRAEFGKKNPKILNIPIGTMIELPRACATADQVAKVADFFSFGTNDLTQTAYGFSRDDTAGFVPAYKEQGVMDHDPFEVLDQEGVGVFVRWPSTRRVPPSPTSRSVSVVSTVASLAR